MHYTQQTRLGVRTLKTVKNVIFQESGMPIALQPPFSIIFVPKFDKAEEALVTPIDKWTFFIKNAITLHVIPEFANEDEGLKTAFIEADKYQWTKEEIIAYDNVTIKEADEVQEKLKVAEKAEEKAKEEMIIGMHEEGISNQQIAKISQKSEAEVAKIIENRKSRF
jgi:hypothetical protein